MYTPKNVAHITLRQHSESYAVRNSSKNNCKNEIFTDDVTEYRGGDVFLLPHTFLPQTFNNSKV